MQKAVIIGFGRFGQLLAKILAAEFDISVIEVNSELKKLASELNYKVTNKEQIADVDLVCLAVPISQTEEVIKSISSYVKVGQLVMDMCSVKVYPSEWMKKYLPNCNLLATHPMFGPDSAKDGLNGLKLVLCPLKVDETTVNYWSEFWKSKGVEVIITTPDEHDQEAIYSQAFTYTIAKMINLMQIPPIKITTKSFESIKKVADFSANDSDQLFHDMLFYNPYFKNMIEKLENVISETSKILDKISSEKPI
jgi:prephenate dehydrogenase